MDHLAVLSADGTVTEVEPLSTSASATSIGSLAAHGNGVVLVAASWTTEPALVAVTGTSTEVLREPRDLDLAPGWLPVPEQIEFPTSSPAGGPEGELEQAHALVYPPTSPDHEAPAGERPPLVVLVHGGPTASVRTQLQLAVAFWTSRGFTVADVDYRGSTGYGRSYRHRLRGGWGVLDVDDCVAVARYLSSDDRPPILADFWGASAPLASSSYDSKASAESKARASSAARSWAARNGSTRNGWLSGAVAPVASRCWRP